MLFESLIRRSTVRLLNRDAWIDYLLIFLVAAFPIFIAYYLDIHRSHNVDGINYIGYLDKDNFWTNIFILPIVLWVLRWSLNKIAPISSPVMGEVLPPVIQLFKQGAPQASAYQLMRTRLTGLNVMGTTFMIVVALMVLDMAELVGVYINNDEVRAGEFDWSVMYLVGVVTKSHNVILVVFAYIVQFFKIFLEIFFVIFIFSHNLFFLSRVYQRSRVEKNDEENYIVIDLDDVNHCFGFRTANDAFNLQIIAVTIFGFSLLTSRFANIYSEESALTLADFLVWPPKLGGIEYFPDMGQWILAGVSIFAFFIISMPAVVKLLPRFTSNSHSGETSITAYLREYLPDSHWPEGANPTTENVDLIAAKFAENSFWPTGNNRAGYLFFYFGAVFAVVLYPLKTSDPWLILLSIGMIGLFAYVFKSVLFFVLKSSLDFVDERLSTKNQKLIETNSKANAKRKLDVRVFISYRREDSGIHARLIRESLLAYMDEDHIFMDKLAIHDGEIFEDAIKAAILECDVLLVVIGSGWLNLSDKTGRPRLFDEQDFVAMEIANGLKYERVIVPVLVGGAELPRRNDLPQDIQPLLDRQARELTDTHWDFDLSELVKAISRVPGPSRR